MHYDCTNYYIVVCGPLVTIINDLNLNMNLNLNLQPRQFQAANYED